MLYELYGTAHRVAKKVLWRSSSTQDFRMVNCNGAVKTELESDSFFNEFSLIKGHTEVTTDMAYPLENIVANGTFPELEESFMGKQQSHKWSVDEPESVNKWLQFIENSTIPKNYKNAGLCYAGYIKDCESWCLPSWIWTNAAVIRALCELNKIDKAVEMADKLIDLQQDCGGWIVRNDYSSTGMIPVIAPNDSAYAANNGCLSIYKITNDKRYLHAAEKCAQWIIDTAREDGLVWLGLNANTREWITNHNIVDIGFTAGLFANLVDITQKEYYKDFLERFINIYVKLFSKTDGSFATGLDKNNEQLGGAFGRGQAWALEGLIPAYKVLKDEVLRKIVERLILRIIASQDKSGGWPYNFERKLLGLDCKATSVLGVDLVKWYPYSDYKEQILQSAGKALDWCKKNTINDDTDAAGGIFSYCMEGAIVHNLYTSTAFVYSSAYAIELQMLMNKLVDSRT